MKLDRCAWVVGQSKTLSVALGVLGASMLIGALGCAGSKPAPRAADPATTQLMSAEVPGPAPRVGKAQLAIDPNVSVNEGDEVPTFELGASSSGTTTAVQNEIATDKEPRRSDGSRRGGRFGTDAK